MVKKLQEQKINKLTVQDMIRLIEFEISEYNRLREETTQTLSDAMDVLADKEHYIGRLREFLNILYDAQDVDIFIKVNEDKK